MSKVIHIVKETGEGFQIREAEAGAEGSGLGNHAEFRNRQELESALRAKGCSDECVAGVMKQLETSDNAEVRL